LSKDGSGENAQNTGVCDGGSQKHEVFSKQVVDLRSISPWELPT
jgi:hypothetical protein